MYQSPAIRENVGQFEGDQLWTKSTNVSHIEKLEVLKAADEEVC